MRNGLTMLTATTSYLERFETIAHLLRSHPEIALVNFHYNPPVSEDEIEQVVETRGAAISDSILTFYRECNGLWLRWLTLDNNSYDAKLHGFKEGSFRYVEAADCEFDGGICLFPLAETFVDRDWKDQLWFDWMENSNDTIPLEERDVDLLSFSKSLRPFDYCDYYYLTAFVDIEPKTAEPAILLGADQGANWRSSYVVDFHTYMEFVLSCFGAVRPRAEVFCASQPKGRRLTEGEIDLNKWSNLDDLLDWIRTDREFN